MGIIREPVTLAHLLLGRPVLMLLLVLVLQQLPVLLGSGAPGRAVHPAALRTGATEHTPDHWLVISS